VNREKNEKWGMKQIEIVIMALWALLTTIWHFGHIALSTTNSLSKATAISNSVFYNGAIWSLFSCVAIMCKLH